MSFDLEKDFTEEQILRCRLKWAVANRESLGILYRREYPEDPLYTCRCCGQQADDDDEEIEHRTDCVYADILRRIGV